MELDHLSPSRLNMYRRCSMQYYYRYCLDLIRPPSGAMTRGSAFHQAVAHNLYQKRETHEDLPLDEVLDAFVTDFDARAPDTEWGEDDPGEMKDTGVAVLAEHHKIIAPSIQPVDVEQQFVMGFADLKYTFTGIADVVTQEAVIEHKTASKKYAEPFHDHKLQIWAYGTGERARTGRRLDGRIDYAVTASQPQVISHPVQFTEADEMYFLTLVAQVANGIEREVWMPNRTHFLCSRRHCGYWQLCEKDCHGRVKD